MSLLYLGVALFALPHFFSSLLPDSRDRLKARIGEGAFKGAYSLITMLGLILMVYAYWVSRGSGEMLYVPTAGMKHVTMLLATLGLILISAAHGKSHLKLWVQHPMSIGFVLWSIAHLLSVGKFAADVFWIAVLAIALLDIVVSLARGKKPSFQPTWRSDAIALVVGLVLTALFVTLFHPYVLGVRLAG